MRQWHRGESDPEVAWAWFSRREKGRIEGNFKGDEGGLRDVGEGTRPDKD